MKKLKKSTAIVLSVVLCVILIVGILFSFVPMTFGADTMVSFSGSINISSDISGGMYGEYQIKTENPTRSDIVSSMKKIKEVFEEDGYKNVNVYAVGTSKIRVEVSFPRGEKEFKDAFSELSNVGSGAFSLRSAQELKDDTKVLVGKTHVKEVKVYTNGATKYISVVFNEAGQKAYKEVVTAGKDSIYLVLGDQTQQITTSNVQDYSTLTLSDNGNNYQQFIALEQRIKLGCMEVEVDGDTACINTMSASLSNGESASSKEHSSFYSSTVYIIAITTIFVVIAVGIALFAVKFGLYSLVMLFTLVFNACLFSILMFLIPSVEIGLSGVAAIILGLSVIYMFAYMFASKVKFEYNQGKSLSASLETAFKKMLPSTLAENIVIFLASIALFAFSFGELTSFAIIFAICAFLSIFTNLLLVPLLIKICISFDGVGTKLFMLKKRSNLFETVDDDDISIKEAE